MRKDTQNRIDAYKERLPRVREKIAASGLSLLIAALVAVSASFAWFTLSRAPSVEGVNMSLISNGSLEIGLSKEDGTSPDEFDIDEGASHLTDIFATNKRWGNIINLADDRYGISKIDLRPAMLNTVSLKDNPLMAASYGSDGRIEGYEETYTYFSYDMKNQMLQATEKYGVRAIAHYVIQQMELSATATEYAQLRRNVNMTINSVSSYYKDNVMTDANIKGLQGLMSAYMQSYIDKYMGASSGGDVSISDYLESLSGLYTEFCKSMDLAKDAVVQIANIQQYYYSQRYAKEGKPIPYSNLTWDDIVEDQETFDADGMTHKKNPSSPREFVSITGLKQFCNDLTHAEKDCKTLQEFNEDHNTTGKGYKWSDIDSGDNRIITRLCDPNSVLIDGKTIQQHGGKNLIGMLGGTYPVVIVNGILPRFEQAAINQEARLNTSITLTGKAIFTVTVTGKPVTTSAKDASNLSVSYANAKSELTQTLKKADDMFGVAVDFWVRTNVDSSHLLLEGAVLENREKVRATGFDGSGNAVDLFTIYDNTEVVESGEKRSIFYDIYYKDGVYYYEGTETKVTSDVMGDQTPTEKYKDKVTIMGYNGVNRVWEETKLLDASKSTTQGSGSCYIYYADSPEEMMRSLRLLSNFRIAFIDSDGKLCAVGSMDTENYYALNGRVTVPVVIDGSITANADNKLEIESADGNKKTAYYITPLYQDVPKRITALIYLDGTDLTNDDVLAANSIQGQLNIQFGSSKDLNAMDDSRLQAASRYVTAEVSKTEMNYDTADTTDALTTTVTVTVEGEEPKTVKASFIRAVNSTQGKREKEMEFIKSDPDGKKWTADYMFTGPGEYYLRYIQLDGVDYTLAEPCKVTVSGFEIASLSWGESGNHSTVYTAEGSYDVPLTVSFQSNNVNNRAPKTVSASFIRTDGDSVFASFTQVGNVWTGTAHFMASGEYALDYLLVDGQYYALKRTTSDGTTIQDFSKMIELHLGISAQVQNDGSTLTDEYDPDVFAGNKNVYNKKVKVQILDNAKNELKNLKGAILKYTRNGSTSGTIDTNLTWDSAREYYVGTLPITAVGRYEFYCVSIVGSTVTKATQAPVFAIIPPDPPKYDENSVSEYHDTRQFVLPESVGGGNTLNAVMGPIGIDNAETATVSATVHNSVTDEDYSITMSKTGTTEKGKIYYSAALGKWIINLPTYTVGEGTDKVNRQAGEWTLVEIKVWDVYETSGENVVYHTEENPLVWNADSGHDFTKLSTTVSDTVKITVVPQSTTVGSAEIPFFTEQQLVDSRMTIAVTDEDGNPIVGVEGLDDSLQVKGIQMSFNYSGNDDSAFGFKVEQNAPKPAAAKFNTYDAAANVWKVSDNTSTSYVGHFAVDAITVTMSGGATISSRVSSGLFTGVPTEYLVYAAAPTAKDNLKIGKLSAYTNVFGKDDNGQVTGAFLQSYSIKPQLDIKVVRWTNAAHTEYVVAEHVAVEGLSANLTFNYSRQSCMEYGGYSSSKDPVTLSPSANLSSGKAQTVTFQQAGLYEARIALGIGTDVTSYATTDSAATLSAAGLENLKNVEVYSVQPTLTITGVSDSGQNITVNKDAGTAASDNTFITQNTFGSDWAVVYMKYGVGARGYRHGSNGDCGDSSTPPSVYTYANYTAPTVTFALTGAGNTGTTVMNIPNGQSNISLTDSGTANITIGSVTQSEVSNGNHKYGGFWGIGQSTCYYYYTTEKPNVIGTQSINQIITTVDGVTYTRTLTNPLFLRQENAPQEGLDVTVKALAGVTVSGTTGKAQPNQQVTLTLTAQEGYHSPRLRDPGTVADWTETVVSETETRYTFTVRFENVTLEPSVQAYPQINWTDGTNMTIASVAVDGVSKGSGVQVKPGTPVTVTAQAAEHYYGPAVTVSGATWSQSREGELTATYTFLMPDGNVTLTGNSAKPMYKLDVEYGVVKEIKDNGAVLAKEGEAYVIPGHVLQITLDVTGSGYDPVLTQPADAVLQLGGTDYIRTYRYTMPARKVAIRAQASEYDKIICGNMDLVQYQAWSNDAELTLEKDGSKSVYPGYTVRLQVTAKPGYYAPRLTQPQNVSGWKMVSETDSTAEYTFTMPKGHDVSIAATATRVKTVTVAASDKASLTLAFTNYDGTQTTHAMAEQTGTFLVQPGQTVEVKAAYKTGYFNPTVSGGGATLTARDGYDRATYTFTMGTADVTLTPGGTQDPLVTVNGNGKLGSIKVMGQQGNARVHPGAVARVEVEASEAYYAPVLVAQSGGITLIKSSGDNSQATYTFTMLGENAVLQGDASKKYKVTTSGSNLSFTVNPQYVIPGEKCSVTVKPATDYYLVQSVSAPSNVKEWTKSSLEYGEATYTFVPTADVTLNVFTAKANPKVNVKTSGNEGGTVTVDNKNVSGSISIRPGRTIQIAWRFGGSDSKSLTITRSGSTLWQDSDNGSKTIIMNEQDITVTIKSDSCVAEGTLITMADGTMKKVEDIKDDDILLAFNHDTGKPEARKVNFIEVEKGTFNVMNLVFSDGTVSRIIDEHGFFDLDEMKYVYFHEDNCQDYVGHRFYRADYDGTTYTPGEVTLEKAYITRETIRCYSPTTEYTLNLFTDNLLSMPGGIKGMFNFFAYDSDLKYNEEAKARDIELYGLATYEDFAEYISYETYCKYPAEYINVSLGKGLMTEDELQYLIERYAVKYEEPAKEAASTLSVWHRILKFIGIEL